MRIFAVVIFCAMLLSGSIFLYADETVDIESSEAIFKEVGILTGYAASDSSLSEKSRYELIPTIFRLGFNLKPLLGKLNFRPRGLVEFEFEPFANTVISPDNNVEVGFNILLKYAYPLTKKIYPYLEGGLGMLYMSQHTREQGTQYNFLPQVGAGVTYFIKDNLAVNLGYRFRHLSNAAAESPNKGINVDMVLAGVSLFY